MTYAVQRPDGSVSWQGHERPRDVEVPEGAQIVETARLGDLAHESLDDRGLWISDPERRAAAIDAAFAADFGPRGKQHEHDAKTLEARVMLALAPLGVTIDGMVAAEAAATGRDPIELAQLIDSRARESEVAIARIARRRDKVEALEGEL